jgi:hypothetical protein
MWASLTVELRLKGGTEPLIARSASVPRYFFHLHEDASVIVDEEGTVLPNDAAARAKAVRGARDLLSGAVLDGRLPLTDIIVVTDHIGQTVLSLRLGASLSLPFTYADRD